MSGGGVGDSGRDTAGRLAGLAAVAVAVGVALESLTFTTSFPTDPLGPTAFPLASAALLGLGGGWAALRPRSARRAPLPGAVWIAVASFVGYALLLEPLGFFTATLAEFATLSVIFGGRPLRSVLAGAVFVGLMHVLFAYGLGLRLPVGSLFLAGG